jgi:hypothetical protein
MIFDLLPLVSAQVPNINAGTLGSSAFKLGYNILTAFVIIVGLTVVFFAVRMGTQAWKKKKQYKVTANIYNRDGTFFTRRMGKFKTSDGVDKMLFQGSNETMPVIPTENIRANQCTLWRYAPGQYAVIPPRMWDKLTPEKFGIEVINMQAKNFAFLEQRAAVSRWAYIKDMLQRLAPYMTMLILAVMVGVACWFLMKLGYNIFGDAVKARTLDCRQLMGVGGAG